MQGTRYADWIALRKPALDVLRDILTAPGPITDLKLEAARFVHEQLRITGVPPSRMVH